MIKTNGENISPEAAAAELRKLVPDLIAINKCPDFVEAKGHYFVIDSPDSDKRALIEYVKMLCSTSTKARRAASDMASTADTVDAKIILLRIFLSEGSPIGYQWRPGEGIAANRDDFLGLARVGGCLVNSAVSAFRNVVANLEPAASRWAPADIH